MKLNRREIGFLSVAILFTGLLAGTSRLLGGQSALPKPDKDTVLKASDIKPKLFPESVFFRGQTAPAQMRNTVASISQTISICWPGWWTIPATRPAFARKYQTYLITEVTLQFGAQTLKPGAYGMDLSRAENLWCWIWRQTNCSRRLRKKTPRSNARCRCRLRPRTLANTGYTPDANL